MEREKSNNKHDIQIKPYDESRREGKQEYLLEGENVGAEPHPLALVALDSLGHIRDGDSAGDGNVLNPTLINHDQPRTRGGGGGGAASLAVLEAQILSQIVS